MEEKIFSNRKKRAIGLIHKIYLLQLKNKKEYTASTKTKSEVRGGGRKPWRQKGTGQARAGSTRSPLFVGGGVIFGPKPHSCEKKINKKERRLAILSALYLKKQNFQILQEEFFDSTNLKETKDILALLQTNNIDLNQKILIIFPEEKTIQSFWLAARNLKNITITKSNCLCLDNLLRNQKILVSLKGLDLIQKTYGKVYHGK